ncbi:glycosyltransferase family 2 protein [Xanthobacter autotrophicus]|uniref:glycosyltransferase family 2 protein n=1 Tax=Xanthobacter autotrophicus TaxID=280 RepID=UPI0024A6503E|nr:glycosyltransferase [Xanthobacter autotrophicus]MDI4657613.1 glycosyltransferase [Xanthobacter autotrophicus]
MRSNTITVSAVIPLYNGAPFIREALDSVLSQTEPADEIIVVDDGSTDDGPAIVEELALHHPITLLRKPNGGQSSARNLAIRHTSCSHVAFLDQDDAWYEEHLEILKRPFTQGNARRLGLVYGNLDQVDRKGRLVQQCCLDENVSPQPKRSLRDCLRHDMFILPGATLASKQAMIDAGLFDERLSGYEDDDLFVRMFALGVGIVYLNVAVTRWRIYAGSTSYSPRMARSRTVYFHKLVELFPDEPRIAFFPTRDAIGPHFLGLLTGEFIAASRSGDSERLRQAWEDIQQVVSVMAPKVRRRMGWVRPIIEATSLGPFSSLSRRAIRHVARDVFRELREQEKMRQWTGDKLQALLAPVPRTP